MLSVKALKAVANTGIKRTELQSICKIHPIGKLSAILIGISSALALFVDFRLPCRL